MAEYPVSNPVIPVAAFSNEQMTMLDAPLDGRVIKERQGAGSKMLKYIDGRTAIETANRIFGKGKWGFRIVARTHERIENKDGTWKEYFTADIELYVLGNPFPFPGDGIGAVKSQTVEGIEMARKDAVTDALKRALCYYGDQFGLALRDEDQMVEMGDGVMVKVKEVQVNKNAENTVKSTQNRVQGAQEHRQISAPQQQRVVESTPPRPQGKQAQAKQPDLSINSIIKQANKYYAADGGWEALRGYIIRKHDLGDIPDEVFTQRHREEMAALITTKARQAQPATADK